MTTNAQTIIQSLMLRSIETGDCLRWYTKAKSAIRQRHPMFRIDGEPVLVRRALYEAVRSPIPDGMSLVPHCGDPCCIRPEHQTLITARQKSRRGAKAALLSPTRSANVAAARRSPHDKRTKLTLEAVRHIRESEETCTALAALYEVSIKTISEARRGTTWRDYGNPFMGLSA